MGLLKISIVIICLLLFLVLMSKYYQLPLNIHDYLKYL